MRLTKEENLAIDEGVYLAKLISIEEKDGKYGPFLSWQFRISDEGDFDDQMVSGMTPARWNEGGKTDKFIQAFGIDVEVGDDIDLDDYVGKKVQVMIQNKTQGDREYSNVISLKRVKPKNKPKPKDDEDEEKPKKPNKKDDDFDFDD